MAIIPYTTENVPNGVVFTWAELMSGDVGQPVQVYTWQWRCAQLISISNSNNSSASNSNYFIEGSNDGINWQSLLYPDDSTNANFRYMRPACEAGHEEIIKAILFVFNR